MMPDAAVWEDIRVAYETTSETKRDIAARFGVSEGAIYRHAKKEGWTLRPSGADGLLIIGAKRRWYHRHDARATADQKRNAEPEPAFSLPP